MKRVQGRDQKFIAVDFDGTCVTHDYPLVGETLPGVVEVLKELVEEGYSLILLTMRSGARLTDAEMWFKDNNIKLYASNDNPSQNAWTQSRKVYAHCYIDDAALGCPLIYNSNDYLGEKFLVHDRPYVDWDTVRYLLEINGFLKPKGKTGK